VTFTFTTRDVGEFIHGYITCALWSSSDQSNEQGGEPLDQNYTGRDIDPDTFDTMCEDCLGFMTEHTGDLEEYCEKITYNPAEGEPMAYAGHDLWLTRNGHGCGYWDRTGAGEAYLYVGDDGRIYG
jgi:hypothetical protein